MAAVGVPIKLLHESQGHICSVETKQSQVFRGKLIEVEDNMSIQLKDVSMTARDGRVTGLEQVYLRGSQLRFIIVPDMLKNAPMFKNIQKGGKGVGLGRGKATVLRAQAAKGRDASGRNVQYTSRQN